MKVCRIAYFNAAHRLYNPEWDDATNQKIFGKCNNPNYHGHNYKIEVWIEGKVNEKTGYVVDLKEVKNIIKEKITDKFDHKNLNLDCMEFEGLIPTAENIAIVCWNILNKSFDKSYGLTVRLWETEKNMVEYNGD